VGGAPRPARGEIDGKWGEIGPTVVFWPPVSEGVQIDPWCLQVSDLACPWSNNFSEWRKMLAQPSGCRGMRGKNYRNFLKKCSTPHTEPAAGRKLAANGAKMAQTTRFGPPVSEGVQMHPCCLQISVPECPLVKNFFNVRKIRPRPSDRRGIL
jgi:hypothetical protein